MIKCILLKESFQRTNFKKQWSPVQWFAVFRGRETSLRNSFVFFSLFKYIIYQFFLRTRIYIYVLIQREMSFAKMIGKQFFLFRRKYLARGQQLVAWKIDVGSGKNRKYDSNLQKLHLSNYHIRTRHDLRVIIGSFWEKLFIVAICQLSAAIRWLNPWSKTRRSTRI